MDANEVVNLEKSIALLSILCSQLDLIDRLNCWGKGPVLVGARGEERPPEKFTLPDGEDGVNIESLFDVSCAMEGLSECFAASCCPWKTLTARKLQLQRK